MKITKLIGLSASVGSMILWFIFTFYNPYTHERVENDVLINTLFTLFAPACVALFGSVIKNPSLMFIAFVWSLPISLYTAMTPSIFNLFGMTSVLYLVSGILFIRDKSLRNKGL
ncbi:hypothetical protein [Paenibacillus radicis (ex Xue et al. 2023)]|uniref:DUF3147 family protein n=1 Tax=Paenibacillus radicis (ex Xue et al. 2023) TaxID=2972489 RepID=A0ABT1YAS2_9BACL|nr:hypothetical protein [Paenibacillus radicis (ex Xue et al. 2023)]MCR8630294.1 hypothetical protein [Paenibacillus radicis (ex Xue et al. 2023)]